MIYNLVNFLKMITIKDDYGKEYNVTDLKGLKTPVRLPFQNGKGDNSLHGKWLLVQVTESFYDK